MSISEIKNVATEDKNDVKIVIFDMDNLKNPHWAGGQARVTYETARRLSKKYIIEVYCSKYPGWKDYTENNISYKHIGLGSNNAKLNNLVYIFAIPVIAMSLKADIIIEDFVAPFSVCFTPLYTKIPVVGRGSFLSPMEMFKKYKIPFNIIFKLAIKMYKYFIALNVTQMKLINKLNPEIKSQLIYNGVDSANFQHPTTDGKYILFMGRIDFFHKGIDMLLQAYGQATKEIDDLLYIMGTGSKKEMDKLSKLIKNLNLTNKIRLLGKKNGEEKKELIANSKFMVFPSRYEGHSLACLESLSFGKPFIHFDVSGFEWIKKNVSIRISPFNIEEYTISIVELSKNKTLRLSMSREAKEFAKEFDWDVVTQKYETYLNQIINKKI